MTRRLGGILALSVALAFVGAIAHAQTPPSNFTAKAVTACRIDLSWTPGTQVTTYRVEYTTTSFFPAGTLATVTAGTSFSHTGLNKNTPYQYRIQGQDGSGNPLTAWVLSTPPSVTTADIPTPTVPTAFTADGHGGLPLLAWTPPTFSDPANAFYRIYRAPGASGGSFALIQDNLPAQIGTVAVNSYTDPAPPAGIVRYQVTAVQGDPNCDLSQASPSAPTVAATVPTAPTGLVGQYTYNGPGVPSQVQLAWVNGVGQSSMEVLRGTSPINLQHLATLGGNTTGYLDATLQAGSSYYYAVHGCVAVTGATGCSSYSNIVNVQVGNAPQNFSAAVTYVSIAPKPGQGQVTLSWNNTFPNTNYVLERAPLGGAYAPLGSPVLAGANQPLLKVTDSNVPFGTVYAYRVRAQFGSGSYSEYSSVGIADLNVKLILRGHAWTGLAQLAGTPTGIGWVDFNSLSTPSHQYSVQVNLSGLFSGAAWASVQAGARSYTYGWLSFNQSDLVGCPSGPCEARFNFATQKTSGWARFILPRYADPATLGGWDGWVSLGERLAMGNRTA